LRSVFPPDAGCPPDGVYTQGLTWRSIITLTHILQRAGGFMIGFRVPGGMAATLVLVASGIIDAALY